MNKFLKTLLALNAVFVVGVFLSLDKSLAYIAAPEPPMGGLTTIRGVVRSPIPVEVALDDGTTYLSANHPLQGVGIFIYECANDSVSCKKNGFLTYPFASTTTNVNGEFYIYMRKIDSVDKFINEEMNDFGGYDKQNESKRRYLVMYCNDRLAGVEILPSWGEWEELNLEAECPVSSRNTLYEEPLFTLAFYNPNERLAPHMGLPDDENLPPEIKQETETNTSGSSPVRIPEYAIQAINSIDPKRTEVPFYLDIEAFDRRFLPPDTGDPVFSYGLQLPHLPYPELGAFRDLDCRIRYEGNPESEKYCLSYGLGGSPQDALNSLHLVEQDGNIFAEDPDNPGRALVEEPWKPLFSSGDFENFWETNESGETEVSHENRIKIKTQLLYYHPRWVVEDWVSGIPYIGNLIAYRNVVAKQDIPEAGQNERALATHSQWHYSNCAGEVYIRNFDEDSTDQYPLCEMYRDCASAVNISSGSGVDSWRNTKTTMGPASQLMSPADQAYIYNFADLNTKICVLEPGGEPITLGQIQPPWDSGSVQVLGASTDGEVLANSSGYILNKGYWSNEFLTHRGDLNDLAIEESYVFENSNDSYDNSVVNNDYKEVGSEADIMQEGTLAVHQSGGYAANNSGKAVYNYTGGYLALTDFYASPVEDALYDRKLASQTSVMSYAGAPKLMAEISNVNSVVEGITQTQSADDRAFPARNDYFGGIPDHYMWNDLSKIKALTAQQSVAQTGQSISPQATINDIQVSQVELLGQSQEYKDAVAYATHLNYAVRDGELYSYDYLGRDLIHEGSLDAWKEEHKGEIVNYKFGWAGLNPALDLGKDGSRSNTEDDKKTGPSWRRDVALSKSTGATGGPRGITAFNQFPGNDFIDSSLQMVSGDGDLRSSAINAEHVDILYEAFSEQMKADDKTTLQIVSDFLAGLLGYDNTAVNIFDTSANKATFDRTHADTTKGTNPALLDYLTVGFDLTEENFNDFFVLPSRAVRDADGVPTGSSDPFWLDTEDWGSHKCYLWNTVGLKGKCDTAKEAYSASGKTYHIPDDQEGISRTCRVDYCLKGTTRIEGECKWNNELGGPVFTPGSAKVVSIDVTNEPCDNNIDNSKDRLTCAQKQISCLGTNTEEGSEGAPMIVPGGFLTNCEGTPINSTKDCMRCDAYGGENWDEIRSMERSGSNVCSKNRAHYVDYSAGFEVLVPTHPPVTISTPACLNAVAGPYSCYGNLREDSTVEVEGQIARKSDAVIDMADSTVANYKSVSLFRPPAYDEFNGIGGTRLVAELYPTSTYEAPSYDKYIDNSFAGKVASFVTVDSTLSRDDRYIENETIGVDNLATGFGESLINVATTRARFSAPNKIHPSASLNPVEFHCDNEDLGGEGAWDCPVWPAPDPPVVDLASLTVNPSCSINATPKCLELVFGEAYTGTTNRCEENNGVCYSGIFSCPTGRVRDNEFTEDCPGTTYCCVEKEEDVGRDYTPYVEPEFSETFLQVINAAATEYKIPASAILAYMASEGSLDDYSEYFSTTFEEELWNASAPWYGVLGTCSDVNTNAQGPYNWILKWFNFVLDKNSERDTLDLLAKHRGNTASRCNFLDSTYVMAMNLAYNANAGRERGEGDCKSWNWNTLVEAIGETTYGENAQGENARRIENKDFGGYEVFKECNPNPVD